MTDTGGDRPPPASGATTFSEWLAGGGPALFASLLIGLLAQYLGGALGRCRVGSSIRAVNVSRFRSHSVTGIGRRVTERP